MLKEILCHNKLGKGDAGLYWCFSCGWLHA